MLRWGITSLRRGCNAVLARLTSVTEQFNTLSETNSNPRLLGVEVCQELEKETLEAGATER